MKEEYENITQDQRLGINEEDRFKSLKKASTINRIIFFMIIGIAIASFIFSKYNEIFIVVLCIIPFILMMIVPFSNGLIKFDTKRISLYPSISGGFIIPILALTLKCFFFFSRIVSWEKIILPMVLLTLLITVVFFITNKNEKITKSAIGGLLFFAILYSFAATVNINTLGKQEIAETYISEIYEKRISRGRTTTYYLTVSPWGNRNNNNDVEVGRNFYDSVEVNDSITIHIISGLLDIRYYIIR